MGLKRVLPQESPRTPNKYTGPLIIDSSTWTGPSLPIYYDLYIGISPYISHIQSHVWTPILKAPDHTCRFYHLSSGPVDGRGRGYRKQIAPSLGTPMARPLAMEGYRFTDLIYCGTMPSTYLSIFEELFLFGVPAGPNNFFVLRFLRVCVFMGLLQWFGDGIMALLAKGAVYNPADVSYFKGGLTMEDEVFVERWEEFGWVLVQDEEDRRYR
ncbi:hypothetical protein BDV06DRAFT_227110 [Aspergillus oleicola]